MKNLKKFILTFLCVISLISNTTFTSAAMDNEGSIEIPYVFPITPGTTEWEELETIEDKINACQIPDDILRNLSTSALLETISNYPLAVNLYAYDSLNEGYNKVKEQFNGLAELDRRMKVTPNATASAIETYSHTMKNSKLSGNDYKTYYMNRIIQATKTVLVSNLSRASTSYVYTPNDSPVEASYNQTWSDVGISQSEAISLHYAALTTYSSATALRDPNPKYNCHSYAWHSTLSSNSYWIADPSEYITDGSYSRVYNYYIGAKILYGTPGSSPEHSAIISGVSGNRLTYVTSKWGALGLYKHLYYDSPYRSNVTSYR